MIINTQTRDSCQRSESGHRTVSCKTILFKIDDTHAIGSCADSVMESIVAGRCYDQHRVISGQVKGFHVFKGIFLGTVIRGFPVLFSYWYIPM